MMKTMKKGKTIFGALLLLLGLFGMFAFSSDACAAEFPSKPITLIVPHSPGGGSDICARLLAQYLQEEFSWTVVVVNNPTGAGEGAFLEVLNARKDGYTVGYMNAGQICNTLMRKTKYKLEDYEFVAMQTSDPRVLLVRKGDERFGTLDEFIKYAKEHPGELTVADSTPGGTEHFCTEAAAFYGGYEVAPLHMTSGAESKAALLGKHVDAISMTLAEAAPMVKEGQGTILAVSAAKRHPMFPDVPTFVEKGIEVEMDVLRGIYVAKGVPAEVIKTLSDAVEKVTENPKYVAALDALVLAPNYRAHEDFTKYVFEFRDDFKAKLEKIGW